MQIHPTTSVPAPAGTLTSSSAEQAALDWLRGELKPRLSGKRVLLYTFNNSGYFGVMEDEDFVTRYQFRDGEIVVAPLNAPFEGKVVHEDVGALGSAIKTLAASGQIVQVQAPRQYEGNVVLYGLPH